MAHLRQRESRIFEGRERVCVEGNPNLNSPYIYEGCDIGPRYGLFGPLFLEIGHIA